MSFEFIRQQPVSNLDITLFEYKHKKTGARHVHLQSKDKNNAFLVAFLTMPQDSTGVAHILEHTVLCGSKRYPVRDPFFMMIRRSLNTFMNAFTAADWTAYPFASQNEKDFYNLLDVYLDATFFPLLSPADFAQEGHRLEFSKENDASSDLVYKGVVYNEMKGAMSSPTSILYQALTKHLFPTLTYHYNSGGDPADIPSLTHEQLCAFHAKHYHPSNALFMTYGDLPVEKHQQFFEEKALKAFQSQGERLNVGKEKRYDTPQMIETTYALPEQESLKQKTHVVNAWLLQDITDPLETMRARILTGVLLDNSSSPLRYALESSELGIAPSPFCGIEDSSKELFFACGLEGCEAEGAEKIEALIFTTLKNIVEEGVEQSTIESVLHQLELSSREITGGSYPFGLKLMLDCLAPMLHGGDPMDALYIDPILDQMRQEIQNPNFIGDLINRLLLNNSHRIRLVLKPSHDLAKEVQEKEKKKLAQIQSQLTSEQAQKIIEQAALLKVRQEQQDDPEQLPKVTKEDVPTHFSLPKGRKQILNHLTMNQYKAGTNGMVYQSIVVPLPSLSLEELQLLPYLNALISELGCGSDDYLVMQKKQAALTGGIRAHVMLRGAVDDHTKIQGLWLISGKALAFNKSALIDLLKDLFIKTRFDEYPRIRELIAQIRLAREDGIVSSGHSYAMGVASQSSSPLAKLSQSMDGMMSIKVLRALDDSLNQKESLINFAERLHALLLKLQRGPYELLSIADETNIDDLADLAMSKLQALPAVLNEETFDLQIDVDEASSAIGWAINAQVQYCAKSFTCVAGHHPDAPVLHVLASFLRNGYLHRAIREQGGAYGGGATYSTATGAFNFFSYRDPRLEETLNDFDASIDWLITNTHTEASLEEAILSVISAIDKPSSPSGECSEAYFNERFGRTEEYLRDYRSRVLLVTLDDLLRVGKKYFYNQESKNRAQVAVLGPREALESAGLMVFDL